MTYGLQIWDSSGNNILDVNDRLTRFHSSVYFENAIAANATLSINVPGLTTDGTWFFVVSGVLIFLKFYITTNYLNFQEMSGSAYPYPVTIEIFRG